MSLPIRDLDVCPRVLLCDLDGTLTCGDRLLPKVVDALYRLEEAGVLLVLVTGRPSGWAQALLHLLPFRAAISENGGLSFLPGKNGNDLLWALEGEVKETWDAKMRAVVDELAAKGGPFQLSADSSYRRVDLAYDWNERALLNAKEADELVRWLSERGFQASRSSVHVNFSPPGINKAKASLELLGRLDDRGAIDRNEVVFVGDSLNDQSAFEAFPHSVGVANIALRWNELAHKPSYLTDSEEGEGFCELCDRLLELIENERKQ